jgi:hypothetical protein
MPCEIDYYCVVLFDFRVVKKMTLKAVFNPSFGCFFVQQQTYVVLRNAQTPSQPTLHVL